MSLCAAQYHYVRRYLTLQWEYGSRFTMLLIVVVPSPSLSSSLPLPPSLFTLPPIHYHRTRRKWLNTSYSDLPDHLYYPLYDGTPKPEPKLTLNWAKCGLCVSRLTCVYVCELLYILKNIYELCDIREDNWSAIVNNKSFSAPHSSVLRRLISLAFASHPRI